MPPRLLRVFADTAWPAYLPTAHKSKLILTSDDRPSSQRTSAFLDVPLPCLTAGLAGIWTVLFPSSTKLFHHWQEHVPPKVEEDHLMAACQSAPVDLLGGLAPAGRTSTVAWFQISGTGPSISSRMALKTTRL